MVCLITAVLLINGWTENVFMRIRKDIRKGAYISADSPYSNFFSFHDPNAGRIILPMMDGGHMILCRN